MKTQFLKVSQFRKKYFAEGSAPCEHTVRQWILLEKIPGLIINGKYFVDEDGWIAFLNKHEPKQGKLCKEDLLLLEDMLDISSNS